MNIKKRIAIIIQYDGTNYYGWQVQKNKSTICGEIEKALQKLTSEKITLYGSGRTDKGVHALGQVAHFDTYSCLKSFNFLYGLNYYLPKDIRIIDVFEVKNNFHARNSVVKKTYIYKIYESKIENPLRRNEFCSKKKLNEKKMQIQAKFLLGEHDFYSFCKFNKQINTIRNIYELHINRKDANIIISITANAFLYNMVRIIVYALIKIGEGKNLDLKKILISKDKNLIKGLAPPNCLYLYKVEY